MTRRLGHFSTELAQADNDLNAGAPLFTARRYDGYDEDADESKYTPLKATAHPLHFTEPEAPCLYIDIATPGGKTIEVVLPPKVVAEALFAIEAGRGRSLYEAKVEGTE